MKKTVLLLLFLIPFFLTGCSKKQNSFSKRDDIADIIFDDTLKHKQYWNKNDSWDFSGVKAHLLFTNEDSFYLDITDKSFSYNVTPNSPADLPITDTESGTTVITLYDIKYTNDNSFVFEINDVNYEVTIVEYPYSEDKVTLNKYAPVFIIIFCLGFLIAVIFIVAHNSKTRTKK